MSKLQDLYSIPQPPCFDSDSDWRAWLAAASQSIFNSATATPHPCDDCTAAFQRSMMARGRCAPPRIIRVKEKFIWFNPQRRRWRVVIKSRRQRYYVGVYARIDDAIRARDEYLRTHRLDHITKDHATCTAADSEPHAALGSGAR